MGMVFEAVPTQKYSLQLSRNGGCLEHCNSARACSPSASGIPKTVFCISPGIDLERNHSITDRFLELCCLGLNLKHSARALAGPPISTSMRLHYYFDTATF